MALLALRSHLPPMDVSVAVRAFATHIAENNIAVALNAGDVLVHAAQGVASPVVIELGDAADWLPSGERVAILARDVQISVGASRGRGRLLA